MRTRIALAVAGLLLGGFGVFRLLTQVPHPKLIMLGIWLIGALVIHDGILSPLVVSVSWVLAHVIPPRARRYVQAGLIMGALVTVIAIPMIYRRGHQPQVKAILQQNFGGNLTVLLGIIAAVSLLLYALQVARDRPGTAAAEPVTGPEPEPVTEPAE